MTKDIQDLGITSVRDVQVGKTYFFEGFSDAEIQRIRKEVLQEDTHMSSYEGRIDPAQIGNPSQFVCIAYQRQVSNPEIDSLEHAIWSIDIPVHQGKRVQTSKMILLYGDVGEDDRKKIEDMMVNVSIEEGLRTVPNALGVQAIENDRVDTISLLTLSDEELHALSESRRLFLTTEEMRAIQTHFRALQRDPTDCELEMIAQAWSEHCGHKTFKADVIMNGKRKPSLYSRLKASTREIAHPDVVSCFKDNSGVVRFDDEDGICIKAETHSAPAAIEPFGGTETGVGGVIRDVLGTGLGARPIAMSDVLCFGDPSLPPEEVPPGCLHPKNMIRKVVAGVESYGNKVGLPNISGAVYFDNCFRTKPVVLAGSISLIPLEKAQKGKAHPGDAMVCMGGKTGRDGIHGATFSSGRMSDKTKALDSTAVQIGYPVLERQVMDVLQKLFERNLIHAITDSGGGGLSSVVTEICEDVGGSIDLHEITTKYQGLQPWELVLSESQERMVVAVAPEDAEEVIALCEHYGINADKIGTFGQGDNTLRLNYKGKPVGELDLGFVLEGNPQTTIEGTYEQPEIIKAKVPPLSEQEIRTIALGILRDLNVCSREGIVRKYDHVVSGCTVSPSFGGMRQDTPQDASILKPKYDSDRGLMTTHGLAPEIGEYDPHAGSLTSIIEAISNAVARGADLSKIVLVDNFIHPRPDNPVDVGTLDRSLEGIVDGAKGFGTPFISGKDSLGGTYNGPDGTVIKGKPMVIVTALSRLENVHQTVPNHFQQTESQIVVLGESDATQLGGSVFARHMQLQTNDVPRYDLSRLKQLFQKLHELIRDGKILSCHDIKDGGLFSAIAEMSFGKEVGATLSLPGNNTAETLFHEAAGRFVLEVSAGVDVECLLQGLPYQIIGRTTGDRSIRVGGETVGEMAFTIEEMKNAHHNPALESIEPVDRDLSPNSVSQSVASHGPAIRTLPKTQPMVTVIKAPGTNSERETAESFAVAGARSRIIDIADLNGQHFTDSQILAIPGGFSYGDDIYAGKVFSIDLLSRFRDSVIEFAEQDKLIIGICNGFQVLVRTGLLPNRKLGVIESNLLHNEAGHFICKSVRLRIEQSICHWTKGLEGRTVEVPIAHGEGRFFAPSATLDAIESQGQVVFRYEDSRGEVATGRPGNPNGSLNAIAGITDPSGRILGLMPHPERDPRNYFRKQMEETIGLDVIRGGVTYFQ
ncbi:MAG: phosphoribosylformylglycinamidine synthase subunit PurL [Candidatus Peribacteraceae bacterium]|nr:phosphoribosylformylglycinamidine synthase subunit PurL [Candidatus Peribacteraceae bacterium]